MTVQWATRPPPRRAMGRPRRGVRSLRVCVFEAHMGRVDDIVNLKTPANGVDDGPGGG
jgi:hypothetical protein